MKMGVKVGVLRYPLVNQSLQLGFGSGGHGFWTVFEGMVVLESFWRVPVKTGFHLYEYLSMI